MNHTAKCVLGILLAAAALLLALFGAYELGFHLSSARAEKRNTVTMETAETPRQEDPAQTEAREFPDQVEAPAQTEDDRFRNVATIDNPCQEGSYLVGGDIPAGEYCLIADDDDMAYVSVAYDPDDDDIIENAIFDNSYFVTVEEGQYLNASRCHFCQVSCLNGYTIKLREDGTLLQGMYRVGIDIPAGKYELTPEDNGYEGYYYRYLSTAVPMDIEEIEGFDGKKIATVYEGDYLFLSNCTGRYVG